MSLSKLVYTCAALIVFVAPVGAQQRPLVVQASPPQESVRVTPEYSREMGRVLIAIPEPQRRNRSDGPDGMREGVDPAYVRAVHHEFLSSVPEYSEVGIIARARDRAIILGWDHLFDSHDNIHLHFIRQPESELDLWTQDLGEYIEVDGEDVFLISATPHEKMEPAHSIAGSRERIARTIFRDQVKRAGFVFEAGNMLFDETPDGLRILVGEDTVKRSVTSAGHAGRKLTETHAAEEISRQFGGATVAVLRGAQRGGLIHIDQAFALLRRGRVVLTTIPDGSSPERELLAGYRDQLEFLGYEILELESTAEDVRAFKTSTNALPYTNRETGDDVVIFPVFPGELVDGAPISLRREHLTGKAEQAFLRFVEAGYRPVPVRDYAHVSGGNTHCIANVLY